jgi:hypothetical protein
MAGKGTPHPILTPGISAWQGFCKEQLGYHALHCMRPLERNFWHGHSFATFSYVQIHRNLDIHVVKMRGIH